MKPGVYKIKSVAEMTGFSPNLLRAWERRYELLDPERKPSGHRLYTEDDRRVLLAVRALMGEGRSIGEIASRGRESLLSRGQNLGAVSAAEGAQVEDAPQVVRLRDGIVSAALELDAKSLQAMLDECFATLDRDLVFERVMVVAIRRLGDLWSRGQASVAHERLASELFCRRLQQWLSLAGGQARSGPSMMTACLPDEQHEMGALLVTYYLARSGADVSYLGSLPFPDLELACRQIQPAFVFLSVTRPELFEVHRYGLAEVVARQSNSRFILGGEGLRGKTLEAKRIGAEHWPCCKPLDELTGLVGDQSHSR